MAEAETVADEPGETTEPDSTTEGEPEFHSILPDVDPSEWTSHDGLIKKKILVFGHPGDKPEDGAKCSIQLSNISVCENSRYFINKDLKEVTVSEEDTEEGRLLERCLLQMCSGEESHIEVKGVGEFNIKLNCYVSSDPTYLMDSCKKVEKAKHHKEKGVQLYKDLKFLDALIRFKKAARLLIFARKDVEEAHPLFLVVCNNMALCNIMLEDYENAITLCNKVIAHEPENVKCLLRRGTAYLKDRNFEKADLDIRKVLELDPQNSKARELLPIIKDNIHEQNVHVNNMVKRMFPY